MAITNNNVKNVQFLRNQTPFETRDLARQALENNKGIAEDGTALLARYTITDGQTTDVKTLIGFVAEANSAKYVTIIDVEGGSEDVEKLREEINAKLGNGIGSGASETVTAQLAALSGNNSSTSAETSVEGAKRYADELKNQMDYTGVTTGTGVYVTNVTQSDGIVSATTATLPTVNDTAVNLKFVTEVDETLGEISVSRGEITSSNKTISLSANTDGGVDFKANVDGTTIIIDESTGTMSVASSALVQYVGDEDTIHISAVDAQNNKTVSSLLTIKEVSTGVPDTVAHRYMLAGTGTTKIGEYIDIPKDSALVNFYLGHVDDLLQGTTAQTEESTSSTVVPGTGDTALVWIMQLANGKYKLTAIDVHSFIDEAEFASGVTWDNIAKKVKGVVDTASEKDSQETPVDFLTVGTDGFKISGIKAEIDRKINALDATGGTQEIATDKHVAVEVVEANGLITAVTVTEDNIADADDLAELSAKTVTEITSSNASISATSAATADGTVGYDLVTDADKIQMSGFSADSVSSLSGIAESDSIATAFEKTNDVITKNEKITAEALIDLDTRLDKVEDEYVSGITVNGSGATVVNNVAALTLTSAPSTGAAETPIIVETSNNGGITLKFDGLDCGYYA